MDQLPEIEARHLYGWEYEQEKYARTDIDWLLDEIKRLRRALATERERAAECVEVRT